MCSGSGIMAATAQLVDFMMLALIRSDRNALNTKNSNPSPNPLHFRGLRFQDIQKCRHSYLSIPKIRSYTSINHNTINYYFHDNSRNRGPASRWVHFLPVGLQLGFLHPPPAQQKKLLVAGMVLVFVNISFLQYINGNYNIRWGGGRQFNQY